MADKTQSEDTAKKFEALEWGVQVLRDGSDLLGFYEALRKAKSETNRPQLIIARTLIGKGIPEVAGTSKAHGEAGAKFVDAARKALGLPEDQHFYVSPETHAYFAEHKKTLLAGYEAWNQTYQAWRAANPALAELLDSGTSRAVPADLLSRIPHFPADAKLATRKAGSEVLQPIAEAVPMLISGSADLHGSTLNYINGGGDFDPAHRGGRNLRFGIREHAMAGMLNGFAYDKIFRPSGCFTPSWFSPDYARPSIRLAARLLASPGDLHLHARFDRGGGGWPDP